jgi:hypothetical protein
LFHANGRTDCANCLPACLPAWPSIYLSIYLYVCLSVRLSVCTDGANLGAPQCCKCAWTEISWSFTQSVGHLGRGISPSQGRYLHTGQHKHRIHTIHNAWNGIRTHDPSAWAGEDSSCLRPRGHYDRRKCSQVVWILTKLWHNATWALCKQRGQQFACGTSCGLNLLIFTTATFIRIPFLILIIG